MKKTVVLIVVCVATRCFAAELHVKVVDETGHPLPCRVMVRSADRTCQVPAGAVTLNIGRDRWFMCAGEVRLPMSPGEVLLRVERGLEFVRHFEQFRVPDRDVEKRIVLKRWIDMRGLGYLCGENHVHVACDKLGPMAIAEGLDFGSSLTWWNGPDARRPVPKDAHRHCELHFGGHTIQASVFDAELEHGWGAAYIQNLPHALPMASDPNRPNLDYLRYANEHGAMVHYQGGWSREVGLDALMGQVHTVNLCNNLFHLHRVLPRRRYSNLLKVEGFPDYPNTDRGMLQMNTETYYRLLNWGLKLSAGAGCACGVKQVPVGYNRTYVQMDTDADLDAFNRAWKAGRNFVTNGPMIFFTTDDGHHPGDEIHLDRPGARVTVRVRVLSDQPLEQIEILQNGRVIKQIEANDAREVNHPFTLPIEQSCWLAARCTARDDLLSDKALRAYGTGPTLRFSRLRFAHTSPIYLILSNRPAVVRESVQEGLKMLNQLEAYAQRTATAHYLDGFLVAIREARQDLTERLRPCKGRGDLSREDKTTED